MFGLRANTKWSNIILLSGEEPITSSTSKEGVKNRVIEIEENEPIIENGRETVSFIRNNYGFAGKEFVELVDKYWDTFLEQFQQVVSIVGEKLGNSKQVNSLSVIILVGAIVSTYIFNDEPVSPDEILSYAGKDVDETDRYYDIIIDYGYANTNKFCDSGNTLSGEVWGKIERVNGEIQYFDFIPQKLYDLLESKGISWRGVKAKFATKGYLIKNNNGEYSIRDKLNGSTSRFIRIKNLSRRKDS